MIRVNLLAPEGRGHRRGWVPREQRADALGLGLLLLTAAAMGGWWWELRRERSVIDRRIEEAGRELEALKSADRLVQSAATRRADLRAKLALVARVRASQRDPVDLLETVSRSVPDGLWLLELKQQGAGIQIEGRATSLAPVTDLAERLQDSGLFKHPVEIVMASVETVEETELVRFVVKADAAREGG